MAEASAAAGDRIGGTEGAGPAARTGGDAPPADAGRAGTARAWSFRLAPSSRVPVRDQVAVQVVAALRAGAYRRGDRLPSVRALASRLGVHRNTVRAAYRRLAAHGVVEPRPGSGVFVAPYGTAAKDDSVARASALAEGRPARTADGDPAGRAGPAAGRSGPTAGGSLPFRGFLARERARGRTWGQVAELLERWQEAVEARRVTVVAADGDLREVWVRELGEDLDGTDVEVLGLSLREARRRPDRLARTVVAAPVGCLAGLRPVLPGWAEGVVLRPGPGPRTRRLLLQLPPGSVLAVASRSRVLRAEIRQLAAALRGGELAVRGLEEPGKLGRHRATLRVARFVLTDMVCRPELAADVGERRLLTMRHLAREAGRELARAFGPSAGSDGPAGPSVRTPPSSSEEGRET